MPIYEYQCESCAHQIELMQKFNDPAPTICEKCGRGPMTKKVSMTSFALKGTGWYVTDFKGGSGANAKKAAAEGETKEATKNASASEKTAPTEKSTDIKSASVPTSTPASSSTGEANE